MSDVKKGRISRPFCFDAIKLCSTGRPVDRGMEMVALRKAMLAVPLPANSAPWLARLIEPRTGTVVPHTGVLAAGPADCRTRTVGLHREMLAHPVDYRTRRVGMRTAMPARPVDRRMRRVALHTGPAQPADCRKRKAALRTELAARPVDCRKRRVALHTGVAAQPVGWRMGMVGVRMQAEDSAAE